MGLPWSGSTGLDVPVGAGGRALASTAAAWCTAPWAVCSGPGLPVPLPAQTGHCSPSSFYFSAKSALISGAFFSPFSFNVCPTNKIHCKWASEGGAVVFFGAP